MRFVFVSEIAAGCGARRSLSTQTSRSGRLANEIEIKIGESALSWGVGRGTRDRDPRIQSQKRKFYFAGKDGQLLGCAMLSVSAVSNVCTSEPTE